MAAVCGREGGSPRARLGPPPRSPHPASPPGGGGAALPSRTCPPQHPAPHDAASAPQGRREPPEPRPGVPHRRGGAILGAAAAAEPASPVRRSEFPVGSGAETRARLIITRGSGRGPGRRGRGVAPGRRREAASPCGRARPRRGVLSAPDSGAGEGPSGSPRVSVRRREFRGCGVPVPVPPGSPSPSPRGPRPRGVPVSPGSPSPSPRGPRPPEAAASGRAHSLTCGRRRPSSRRRLSRCDSRLRPAHAPRAPARPLSRPRPSPAPSPCRPATPGSAGRTDGRAAGRHHVTAPGALTRAPRTEGHTDTCAPRWDPSPARGREGTAASLRGRTRPGPAEEGTAWGGGTAGGAGSGGAGPGGAGTAGGGGQRGARNPGARGPWVVRGPRGARGPRVGRSLSPDPPDLAVIGSGHDITGPRSHWLPGRRGRGPPAASAPPRWTEHGWRPDPRADDRLRGLRPGLEGDGAAAGAGRGAGSQGTRTRAHCGRHARPPPPPGPRHASVTPSGKGAPVCPAGAPGDSSPEPSPAPARRPPLQAESPAIPPRTRPPTLSSHPPHYLIPSFHPTTPSPPPIPPPTRPPSLLAPHYPIPSSLPAPSPRPAPRDAAASGNASARPVQARDSRQGAPEAAARAALSGERGGRAVPGQGGHAWAGPPVRCRLSQAGGLALGLSVWRGGEAPTGASARAASPYSPSVLPGTELVWRLRSWGRTDRLLAYGATPIPRLLTVTASVSLGERGHRVRTGGLKPPQHGREPLFGPCAPALHRAWGLCLLGRAGCQALHAPDQTYLRSSLLRGGRGWSPPRSLVSSVWGSVSPALHAVYPRLALPLPWTPPALSRLPAYEMLGIEPQTSRVSGQRHPARGSWQWEPRADKGSFGHRRMRLPSGRAHSEVGGRRSAFQTRKPGQAQELVLGSQRPGWR
nr:basic proline-rich protein-like [Meriones unguiculatus]